MLFIYVQTLSTGYNLRISINFSWNSCHDIAILKPSCSLKNRAKIEGIIYPKTGPYIVYYQYNLVPLT